MSLFIFSISFCTCPRAISLPTFPPPPSASFFFNFCLAAFARAPPTPGRLAMCEMNGAIPCVALDTEAATMFLPSLLCAASSSSYRLFDSSFCLCISSSVVFVLSSLSLTVFALISISNAFFFSASKSSCMSSSWFCVDCSSFSLVAYLAASPLEILSLSSHALSSLACLLLASPCCEMRFSFSAVSRLSVVRISSIWCCSFSESRARSPSIFACLVSAMEASYMTPATNAPTTTRAAARYSRRV
mmetsp:Transcript_42658/g.106764  ORF Transcript_42658/g.106764 Transcript_42658/m.106764 type:complete len:245 (-) Transcript_42658:47-781(-)